MASPTLPRGFAKATADDVRAFAKANGLPFGGSRGRLPKATIEAFNTAHSKGKGRSKYVPGLPKESTYRQFGPKGGLRKEATIEPHIVRQWAAVQGYDVAARGRLSRSVIDAFMAEGV